MATDPVLHLSGDAYTEMIIAGYYARRMWRSGISRREFVLFIADVTVLVRLTPQRIFLYGVKKGGAWLGFVNSRNPATPAVSEYDYCLVPRGADAKTGVLKPDTLPTVTNISGAPKFMWPGTDQGKQMDVFNYSNTPDPGFSWFWVDSAGVKSAAFDDAPYIGEFADGSDFSGPGIVLDGAWAEELGVIPSKDWTFGPRKDVWWVFSSPIPRTGDGDFTHRAGVVQFDTSPFPRVTQLLEESATFFHMQRLGPDYELGFLHMSSESAYNYTNNQTVVPMVWSITGTFSRVFYLTTKSTTAMRYRAARQAPPVDGVLPDIAVTSTFEESMTVGWPNASWGSFVASVAQTPFMDAKGTPWILQLYYDFTTGTGFAGTGAVKERILTYNVAQDSFSFSTPVTTLSFTDANSPFAFHGVTYGASAGSGEAISSYVAPVILVMQYQQIVEISPDNAVTYIGHRVRVFGANGALAFDSGVIVTVDGVVTDPQSASHGFWFLACQFPDDSRAVLALIDDSYAPLVEGEFVKQKVGYMTFVNSDGLERHDQIPTADWDKFFKRGLFTSYMCFGRGNYVHVCKKGFVDFNNDDLVYHTWNYTTGALVSSQINPHGTNSFQTYAIGNFLYAEQFPDQITITMYRASDDTWMRKTIFVRDHVPGFSITTPSWRYSTISESGKDGTITIFIPFRNSNTNATYVMFDVFARINAQTGLEEINAVFVGTGEFYPPAPERTYSGGRFCTLPIATPLFA